MKMARTIKRITAFILIAACFAAFAVSSAFADSVYTEGQSIINDKELTGLVENFMSERGISKNGFSIGFCYTATGDTWYYNGDKWFYPASMYKVPLMMLLSEKVASGELDQEKDLISGLPISTLEEYILTYSNNDYAHAIRSYLGGDEVWRNEVKKYSTLRDDEYDPDFIDHCYFSNRYITEVMKTLYFESERFPNIIESLMDAEPQHYFKLSMGDTYNIAQKYGSYCDDYGKNFNHTTGVVYTENPCVITVMTCNVGDYEKVISDTAQLMVNYSQGLDKKLKVYIEEQNAAAAEAKRIEMEQAAEQEKQKANEERIKVEAEVKHQAIENQATLQNARKTFWTRLLILAAAIVAISIITGLVISSRRRRKRAKRYEAYRKRYEAEKRAAQGNAVNRKSGYKPKH